jgi:hypothetical protein
VRRIIGKLVVAALLSGGAVASTASPSSALPRDTCMDEVQYFQALSWYQNMEFHALDVATAWGAAVHEVNPVSGESWTANLPGGYQTVFTQADYNSRFNSAYASYLNAAYATVAFEATPFC